MKYVEKDPLNKNRYIIYEEGDEYYNYDSTPSFAFFIKLVIGIIVVVLAVCLLPRLFI